MKRKKILIIFIIILIIMTLFGIIYLNIIKKEKSTIKEYIPEKEFSEKERQTIVTLYFLDKETLEVVPEPRLINLEKLIKNPEQTLIELLIEGSKNNRYISAIPQNTEIIKVEKKGEETIIELSDKIFKNEEDKKKKAAEIIKRTITQLNEIDRVKIIIGNEILSE